MLIALILAAEVAFWLILLSGLAARYVFGRPRLGLALLVATPLVDLALLGATSRPPPRRRGSPSARARGRLHRRLGRLGKADGRLGGRPLRPPLRRRAVARAAPAHGASRTQPVSGASGCATWWRGAPVRRSSGSGVLAVGDLERTQALLNVAALWTLVLAIDFLISFSYALWPRQASKT